MRRKGFTLLELLVVISIIGILVSLGAVAFTTAQRKGRDARRSGDLKAVQNAMEQYYSENTAYVSIGGGGATCADGGGNLVGIMESLPTDPKNDATYFYSCNNDVPDAYCISVQLEQGTGNCAGCACAAGDCTFNSGTTHFCVKNLQ